MTIFITLSYSMSVSAQVAPPTVDVFETFGFSNVLEEGDVMVLVRYNLPTSEWRKDATTTPFMADSTCSVSEDKDDLKDRCWTSLKSGVVTHNLYDAPIADGGFNHGVRKLPRIGDGLSAIYLRSGHGITIGTATAQSCIQGSSTIFSPNVEICSSVIWQASTSLGDNSALTNALIQTMTNLEANMNMQVGSFVSNQVITEAGILFPMEAMPAIVKGAPDAFYSGVSSQFDDYSTVPQGSALESAIIANTSNSTIYKALDNVGQQYLGMNVRTFGTLGTFTLALIVLLGVGGVLKNMVVGTACAFVVVLAGTFMGLVLPHIIWTVVAVCVMFGATFLYRRMPQ